MKSTLVAKVAGSVAVVATCAWLAYMVNDVTVYYLSFFLAFVGLVAVHATADSPPRDYTKNPVTQEEIDLEKATERRRIMHTLVNHLESTAHECGDYDPCPVPDILSQLGAAEAKPERPGAA